METEIYAEKIKKELLPYINSVISKGELDETERKNLLDFLESSEFKIYFQSFGKLAYFGNAPKRWSEVFKEFAFNKDSLIFDLEFYPVRKSLQKENKIDLEKKLLIMQSSLLSLMSIYEEEMNDHYAKNNN